MEHGQFIPMTDDEQRAVFGPVVRAVADSFPASVSLAMGGEQARRLGRGTVVCVDPELPDSEELYYERVGRLPGDLVTFVSRGWETVVDIPREHIGEVMALLYPEGLDERYWRIVSAIEGDTIRLIGFGD